jgi:hypothetical protein
MRNLQQIILGFSLIGILFCAGLVHGMKSSFNELHYITRSLFYLEETRYNTLLVHYYHELNKKDKEIKSLTVKAK